MKKINFNCVFYILGFFIILYQPPIFSFNTIHLVGLFSVVGLILLNRNLIFEKKIFSMITFFIFLFIYLLVFSCGINGGSISNVAFPIYFLIDIIPFGFLLKQHLTKEKYGTNVILDYVVVASLIQAFTAITAFVFPSVQKFFMNRIIEYGYSSNLENLASMRMYGFSPFLTFGTPVVQSFLSAFVIFGRRGNKLSNLLMGLLLFFSAIINARISIFVFLVGVLSYLIGKTSNRKEKTKNIIILTVGVLSFLGVFIPIIGKNSPMTYQWLVDGLDEIKVFFNPGSASNYSYYTYFTKDSTYVLPSSIFNFMFGKGSYIMTTNNLGVRSDIGFINDIWLGGIFYSALVYIGFYKLILKLVKDEAKHNSYLGLFFLLLMPILNLKGIAFTMFSITNLIVIVFICSINSYDEAKTCHYCQK